VSAILDERSGAGWRMLRADSLLALRDLPAESVDAVITDPPYSSGGKNRATKRPSSDKYTDREDGDDFPEIVGEGRDQRSLLAWCALWMAECLRVSVDGAAFATFTDWRQFPTMTDAVQAGGWLWRGTGTWCKPIGSCRSFAGRVTQASEYVLWGTKGPMPPDRDAEYGPGYWVESSPGREREHITEKPMGVMRDLAKQCVRGGAILDPFGGASTTGCAALLEGRRFIGIETSPAYFEIACRRLAETEAQAERGSFKNGQTAMFGGGAA